MRAAILAVALAGCAASPKIVFHPNADGSPTPPVIVDPRPDAVIVDVRPPITLALPPGTERAQIELCADAHCEKILSTFDTTTTRAQTPIDLGSGVYWLRPSARAGGRVGKTGPIQRFALERRATVTTRHFTIDGPGDSREALEAAGRYAEDVLAFYLGYLGLEPPTDRLALSYYVTEDGYHFATHALDADKLSDHAGFTRLTHSYMRWHGRPARATVAGAGALEHVTAHELAHQMQALPGWRLVARIPPWLAEGSADLLAELAMAHVFHLPMERLVPFFARYEGARQARKEGYAIPVKLFFDAKYDLWQNKQRRTVSLFYSEGYALLQSLATPPERMRGFLRDVWSHGANVDLYVGGKMRQVFGDTAEIQAKLDAWIDAAPSRALDRKAVDVRLLAADAWHAETLGAGVGVVTPLAHGGDAKIELDADFDGEADATGMTFGVTGKQVYTLLVAKGGRVALRSNAAPLNESRQAVPLSGRHRLTLVLDGKLVTASIDGAEQLRAALPAPVSGRAGVAVQNGRILVHALQVTASTPSP